jgi:hypothetical protein
LDKERRNSMKRSTWLIMICALFLTGSTASVGQAGPAVKDDFTAADTFDPTGGCFGSVVGTIEEYPTITCPGGELLDPAPDPWENPCTAGSRIHIRGYVITTEFISTDSRVEGVSTIAVNANFDADGSGPAWGTISIAPDDGGTWDGVWEGIRKKVDGVWIIPVHASLRGSGPLEGMRYKAVDTIMTPTFVVVCYTGVIEGRILDPHP